MMWLGYALFAFVAAVAGQAMLLRRQLVGDGMRAFLLCGFPAGAALMVVLFRFYPELSSWAGTLLYAFLCEVWMFAFSSIFSSVSARLMLHLRRGAMRRSDIDSLYDNAGMIRRRIGWLCEIGAAEAVDGRLRPTRRGRRLAAAFNAARGFFGHQ